MSFKCLLHPEVHNTFIFTDASNQCWGTHLENMTVAFGQIKKKNITHQCPRTKSSVSSPKKLSKQSSKRHCSPLSEEKRCTHS